MLTWQIIIVLFTDVCTFGVPVCVYAVCVYRWQKSNGSDIRPHRDLKQTNYVGQLGLPNSNGFVLWLMNSITAAIYWANDLKISQMPQHAYDASVHSSIWFIWFFCLNQLPIPWCIVLVKVKTDLQSSVTRIQTTTTKKKKRFDANIKQKFWFIYRNFQRSNGEASSFFWNRFSAQTNWNVDDFNTKYDSPSTIIYIIEKYQLRQLCKCGDQWRLVGFKRHMISLFLPFIGCKKRSWMGFCRFELSFRCE